MKNIYLFKLVVILEICFSVFHVMHAESETVENKGLQNDFFAFDLGVGFGKWSPQEQAKVLKEMGYDGIMYMGVHYLAVKQSAIKADGLKVYSLYVDCAPSKDTPYHASLIDGIKQLEGTETIIWLTISGKTSDEKAVSVVGELADEADKYGVRIALYHHAGFYVATARDALRLVNKIYRSNVGLSIDLCHELHAGNAKELPNIIKETVDKLFLVSINGADHSGGWDKLIQTLDKGNYDVLTFLKNLKSAGYTGPIGLQNFGLKGDDRDNLNKSMKAWKFFSMTIATEESGDIVFKPNFYAFQNGLGLGSIDSDAQALKKLGYDGVSQVFQGGSSLAQRIAVYDEYEMKVLSIYLKVMNKAIPVDVVKPLANREAMIELTINKITPQTVEAVRETVEMAERLNIKVALYPHHGFAVAKMSDAMDLIKKVNHPNLGVMFNLCHFLKNEDAGNLERVIDSAGSRLFAVSISGANLDGSSWKDLIKPLGQGSFPQARLLKHLKQIYFKGPIGLQCYGIEGDKFENLKASMNAWKSLSSNL